MAFVFSPSNMMEYRSCPRRFQGRYITKEIPYKETPATERGKAVHEKVETSLKRGYSYVKWDDPKLDMEFIKRKIASVLELREQGCELLIEHEMIITKEKKVITDWFSQDAWIRARADAIILPPKGGRTMTIIDVKTGKMWDKEDFQLTAYAYLASHIWDMDWINYSYWYVDSGQTAHGRVNLQLDRDGPFTMLLSTIKDMEAALRDNFFECKKNKTCRWCAFYRDKDKCDITA